jgi:NitT/TauT family transport system ATP-binding protein/nitrate/nitrite transport system substrate-binding protein
MSQHRKSAARALPVISAGFVPLIDCAPLVIASALGIDARHGFKLKLGRELSWASIRDRLNLGYYDVAQLLAPMPLAARLGINQPRVELIAPMSLGLNGNAITVSRALHAEMQEVAPEETAAGGMASALALRKVIGRRCKQGAAPLSLGMVFPFSCHNYQLRAWLAAAGIHPDTDVRLIVLPPPLMVESLKAGHVDGFCVGAPWNTLAVGEDIGRILATGSQLWSRGPEKVLGMTHAWATAAPERLGALIRALDEACRWLDDPASHREAAALLARPHYLDLPAELLLQPLGGHVRRAPGGPVLADPDYIIFHRDLANFPWRSHAVWLLTQMIRWGQLAAPVDLVALAGQVYRPDLYRAALPDACLPVGDMKLEGGDAAGAEIACRSAAGEGRLRLAGGAFFGGDRFDPQAADAYLERQTIRSLAATSTL